MVIRRIGRLFACLALVAALSLPTVAWAETGTNVGNPADPAIALDFSKAQYVYISLGGPNDEQGIRLIEGQADGLTEVTENGGRKALPNAQGPNRYFYFDVHDTYMKDSFNQVIMTVTYEDVGLTPIDLEYDAFDVINPENKADEWVKKRVNVAMRTNSNGFRTARIVLDDARFGNNQPGGADFRLVSGDGLVIRNISLMRTFAPSNLPVRVVVDKQEVIFDVAPFINPETNLTLVPMRKLFNALGVPDSDIQWDGVNRTVTARKGQTTIVLSIDSDIAMVGGNPVKLSQPAIVKDGRTLIPLRFVSENLGLKVGWNDAYHLISIDSTQVTPPTLPVDSTTPPDTTTPPTTPTNP